jgi:hypothetical protein
MNTIAAKTTMAAAPNAITDAVLLERHAEMAKPIKIAAPQYGQTAGSIRSATSSAAKSSTQAVILIPRIPVILAD